MSNDCANCYGDRIVSISIPCPECKGGGLNELDELRKLAKWVDGNFKSRSRPPVDGSEILRRVKLSQGK